MRAKDTFARGFTFVHTHAYRLLGGRLVGKFGKAPMLLLTTTGRKTGAARTTPLLYLPVGDSYVIVASWGGDERNPLWYLNLVADPHVTVQIGAEKQAMTARTATPEEKARLWPELVAIYRQYEGYQRKTERDIPLVILESQGDG